VFEWAIKLNETLKIEPEKPVGPNCSITPLSIVLKVNEYPKFIILTAITSLIN
jgi:hypothetical protein